MDGETSILDSKMCPVVRDSASHTCGVEAFGSTYATATVSPLHATAEADARSPYTIGTGE
jgi:hypothetical protein